MTSLSNISCAKGFDDPASTSMLTCIAINLPLSSTAIFCAMVMGSVRSMYNSCSSREYTSFMLLPVRNAAVATWQAIMELYQMLFVVLFVELVFLIRIFDGSMCSACATVFLRWLSHCVGV